MGPRWKGSKPLLAIQTPPCRRCPFVLLCNSLYWTTCHQQQQRCHLYATAHRDFFHYILCKYPLTAVARLSAVFLMRGFSNCNVLVFAPFENRVWLHISRSGKFPLLWGYPCNVFVFFPKLCFLSHPKRIFYYGVRHRFDAGFSLVQSLVLCRVTDPLALPSRTCPVSPATRAPRPLESRQHELH